MSEEEKDNVFKINVPIITDEELKELDYVIENDIDNIVNKVSKTISKDRDIIFLKKVIDKLQKDNKKYIDVFNSTEKIMNRQERTKDKLLKENVELQKENEELKRVKEQSQKILSSIKIAYMVHTKDCELLLKDIKKWKKC